MTATGEPPSTAGSDGAPSISAGRVGRAHGLDGSFYVTGPRPRLLAVGTALKLADRVTSIVRRAGTDVHPIVRLQGVEDRKAAEALRGTELRVDRTDAPSLEEGEWWAGDLEGCEVFDGERLVGVVKRLIELPSCEALEVALSSQGSPHDNPEGVAPKARAARELLIPMVRDAVRQVDISRHRIDVDMSFLEDA